MRAFVAMGQMTAESKVSPIAQLEKKVEALSEYVEEILEDVNEDTRMQLELRGYCWTSGQASGEFPRKRIGFAPQD